MCTNDVELFCLIDGVIECGDITFNSEAAFRDFFKLPKTHENNFTINPKEIIEKYLNEELEKINDKIYSNYCLTLYSSHVCSRAHQQKVSARYPERL